MSNVVVVDGFPMYKVCSSGRVYSVKRSKWLKPQNRGGGYMYVDLGKENPRRVHRLVAQAFIPNPDGKPHVNHIDGNKQNNKVENLEWCTRSENTIHAYRTGLMNIPRHELRHNARLSKKDVLYIRKSHLSGTPQSVLAKQYNVCQSGISRIVNNKYWIGV
jgi:hypothetical protein